MIRRKEKKEKKKKEKKKEKEREEERERREGRGEGVVRREVGRNMVVAKFVYVTLCTFQRKWKKKGKSLTGDVLVSLYFIYVL